MKRFFGFLLAAVVAIYLQGCFGSGGNSASAPTGIHIEPKDSRVVVTWNESSGVEYWIYAASGVGVTPENCSSMTSCKVAIKATSPASISNLVNGYSYSFSINARSNGGPGGPGSSAISETPRMSGAAWNVGSVTGPSDLYGVTYGAADAKFVATGASGALFSGLVWWDSTGTGKISWTPMTNPMSGTTFYAVNRDATHAKYLAVGQGGAVISASSTSSDWTPAADTKTTNDLYALANNSGGFTVAAGDNGTIITSSDASTWTLRTSGTMNALHGVTYGYDATNLVNAFVAVGDAGTIRYSKDGQVWTTTVPTSLPTTPNLKSVTFGATYGASTGLFVAVGAGGVVYTSEDGLAWTQQTETTIPATAQLNAVTYSAAYSTSGRFVAVAENGSVYYSEYSDLGVTWTAVAPQGSTASPIRAIATGGLYDYLAVGTGGVNLYAD
jgi:hypothetical protein